MTKGGQMPEELNILNENEKQANRIVAKVMGTTFLIFTVIYLLNVCDVFVIRDSIMNTAYLCSGIFLLLPAILTYLLKLDRRCVKYINVVAAVLFVMLLCTTLTYHVVVIYVYPIAIASLYFSKRLNIIATVLTVTGVSLGQLAAFYMDTLQDDNFTVLYDTVLWGIIPRAMVLTAEEYERMKQHAESGGKIVQETFGHLGNEQYARTAYEVARHHHEKWNGKGYPDGLTRKEIPLCARIMAVADVFDAVSEKRCYREAMPLDKCFEIIQEGSGQDFDPVLVEVFLDIRDKVEQIHAEVNH